ncbi:hypothetical protein CPB83DRAFT_841676 [Crepidotus variabilis]|uniref:Uncharacterized protein n=1 Tax=Crepidotus variabilis TaxID=179855 RepID=A0A9P6JWA6_9AGAR|nr:hypothetical protein CPB83DRAFT_841676 [Crepidotus variabilis]
MRGDLLFLSWRTAILFALAINHLAVSASAFSFSYTTPTQCDDVTVNWQGGQPPFTLLVIPPSQTMQNFSIPSSNFNNNAGSFTTQLILGENTRVMFAMSDATGVTAGGISPLLSVGSSTSGATCNTTVRMPDFFFSLNGDLKECMPYTFSQYSGAILPIRVMGFIPSGPFFSSSAPDQSDTYVWKNTYPAGTPISFTVVDSQGRSGGTSNIRTVMASGDTSCKSQSVIFTTSSPTDTASSSSTTNNSSDDRATGIIGAAMIAGIVILILGFVGGCCCLCWKIRRRAVAKASKNKVGAYELLAPNTTAPEGVAELVNNQAVTPFPLHNSTSSQIASSAHSSLAITPYPLPVPVPPIVISPSEKTLYHASRPSASSITPTHSPLSAASSPHSGSLTQVVTPFPLTGIATTTSKPANQLYPDNRPSTSTSSSVSPYATHHAGPSTSSFVSATYRDPFVEAQPQVSLEAQGSPYNPENEHMDLPPEYSEDGPTVLPVQTLSTQTSTTSLQPVRRS